MGVSKKQKDVVQEDFTTLAKKLRKTEVVKRPIEKQEIETVELVHHEFEAVPQNPVEEMTSRIKIRTKILHEIPDIADDEEESASTKKKKKRIVKISKKDKKESEEPLQASKKTEEMTDVQEEMKTAKDLKPVQLEEDAPVKKAELAETTKPLKKVPQKVKVEEKVEEPFPTAKMKKAEIETVDLIHHEFENNPINPEQEEATKVKITSHGDATADDENENKKKTKKTKKVVKKPIPSNDIGDKEPSTKEISPAIPEAPSKIEKSEQREEDDHETKVKR